jgi:hypothetical protein
VWGIHRIRESVAENSMPLVWQRVSKPVIRVSLLLALSMVMARTYKRSVEKQRIINILMTHPALEPIQL